MSRPGALGALVLAALLAGCMPQEAAAPAGDAGRGKAVAMRWCYACRVVTPGDTPRPEQVAAPPFAGIASAPSKDRAFLARLMGELHPPMPTYRLFPEEKADLIAYFDALRPRR